MKKASGIPKIAKAKAAKQAEPEPVQQPAKAEKKSGIPQMGKKAASAAPAAVPAVPTVAAGRAKTPAKAEKQKEAVAAVEQSKIPKMAKAATVTAPQTNKASSAAAAAPKQAQAQSGKKSKVAPQPVPESEEEEEEESEDEEGESVEDSSDMCEDSDEDDEEDDDEEDSEEGEEEDDDFEQQSSDDDSVYDSADDYDNEDEEEDEEGDEDAAGEKHEEHALKKREERARFWNTSLPALPAERSSSAVAAATVGKERSAMLAAAARTGELQRQQFLDVDDLSSDDEALDERANTIGRVPLHWYDAFDHVGYTLAGEKLMKRTQGDRIDRAIAQRDDPLAMRRVYDMYNDREVVLSERELEIIRRIQNNAFAHPEFNDTPDYVDYFTHEQEQMPLTARDDPKARFLPSKWETMRVLKIARAIKEGRYVFKSALNKDADKAQDAEKPMYLIWNDAEDEVLADSKRMQFHLPAPKMPLPGHAESYNPPAEYLLTDKEKEEMENLDREDRPLSFLPKSHACLRHVGAYQDLVRERFERCLDLYLCPRKLKKRLNIDPESLVPKLPHPRELKPFPNTLALQFLGHKGGVRTLALSVDGQYLASGGEDGTVRLWETDTCLCRHVWQLGLGPVTSVSWNPDPQHCLLLATAGKSLVLITTGTGDADALEVTESQLHTALQSAQLAQAKEVKKLAKKNKSQVKEDDMEESEDEDDDEEEESEGEEEEKEGESKGEKKQRRMQGGVRWTLREDSVRVESKSATVGPRVTLSFAHVVSKASWHHKGDYLVALCPTAGAGAVSVHQLSKANSQFPFSKSPGNVQAVSFHPSLPCLILATQQHVKLYHLVEQKLVKKLVSGCKWLSSFDTHSSGDHIIVGSYDRRVVWFDLDLSSTPYKTLKFHEKAVRDVKFHRRYPLMASASDDGSVHVFHSMVYSDMMKNPLIVPLKVLKGHGVVGEKGVLSVVFHPRQPWIFTSGADGIINLYQDI